MPETTLKPNWFYPLFATCAVCDEPLQFDIDPNGTPERNGDWGTVGENGGDYGCGAGDEDGADSHVPIDIEWRPTVTPEGATVNAEPADNADSVKLPEPRVWANYMKITDGHPDVMERRPHGLYMEMYGGGTWTGPFVDVPAMARFFSLTEYPDFGCIYTWDGKEIGSVPSLNPDDLVPGNDDDTPEPDPAPKYWAANDEAPATAWFYQTGNRWVAVVAENENEAEWFEDATTDRKTWPIMRTHPIKHVPTTGMLLYRTAKGREVWEREGEEVVVASGPPTLEAAIDRAKREILDEVQAGRFVGSQITCFADLHDHMDANTLGGLAADDFPLDGDEQIEFGNALQAALDEWIKNNGMTDGIEARNDRWLTVGELRRHLARFPDDTPITATNAGGVDYLNVVCASNPYESGEPSLVLDTRDDFDVRQF